MTPYSSKRDNIIFLAARMIRSFEGCKLAAYWDAGGKCWTIGFGHTKDVTCSQLINLAQAELFLSEDAAPIVTLVEHLPIVAAAALVSFGYNCGISAAQRVLDGGLKVTPDGFMTAKGERFGVLSGGSYVIGLDARRKLEAALYLTATAGNGYGYPS